MGQRASSSWSPLGIAVAGYPALSTKPRRPLTSERPVLSAVEHHLESQLVDRTEGDLAVPLELSGETVGVVAISGPAKPFSHNR